jgi:hypothetical protein
MAFEVLEIKKQPDEQLVDLLQSNIIGTPGESMLYQHAKVRDKVYGLSDPVFCNLSIRNKLYGTITFCGRNIQNKGKGHWAYYLRYFTFVDEFRSKSNTKRRGEKSTIREDVHRLMNGEGLRTDTVLLLYAYVDEENVRSRRLIEEFGFNNAGSFHIIPFSRLSPRKNIDVEVLENKERHLFIHRLADFYKDHQLVSFENLRHKGEYFVVREKDQIVCGVQGIYDQWKIIDLPGWSGKIMMHLIPKMPWLKKLFNPDYRFVFLEAIFCHPGHETDLGALIETVLAHFSCNSGIICMDPRSKLYSIIQRISLGLTHKIMGEKEIEVVVKSSDKKMIDTRSPFFISGYDVL